MGKTIRGTMAEFYRGASAARDKRNMALKVADIKGCVHFPYEEMKKATKGFDQRPVKEGGCKLGEGGFGPVFKGTLKCTEVAIKGISKRARGGMGEMVDQQFLTEVEVLSKFRHPNLVTLLGYSADGEVPYLVYEFLSNGTLEDAIEYKYEQGVGIRLSWQMRLSIALDTARGLLYLHTAIPGQPLVHRDVKSANILLDLAYRAKVGDFGLARCIGGAETKAPVGGNRLYHKEEIRTVNIVGTSGYIPKEYLRGIITPKMDVYAFGVIILELVTGLASYDSRRTIRDLTTYLNKELEDVRRSKANLLMMRVDPEAGSWPSDSIIELGKLANSCLEEDREKRLDMIKVYDWLDKILVESAKTSAEDDVYKKKAKTTTLLPGPAV